MINHKTSVADQDHSSHAVHGHDDHNSNNHHVEHSHDHHSHDTHAAEHTAHDVHEHIDHKKHAAHDAHDHVAKHHDDGHKHHDGHGHDDHGHGGHSGGHGSHGHGGGHGGHGGHGEHGGHGGGHGGHGGGHGEHGDHGGGSKMLGIIGLGAILGLMVLLGIPTLFSKIDQILVKRDVLVDSPSNGLLSSYTVANAQAIYAAKVIAVEHLMMDTPKSSMPVTYLTLSTGERLMSMDMSAFKNQGISSSAVFMSKEAYQRAKNLVPGKVNLKVTGEPPVSLILTGIAPLIIELESLY